MRRVRRSRRRARGDDSDGGRRHERARSEDRGGARGGAGAPRARNALAPPAVVAGRDPGARARRRPPLVLVHGAFDNAALWTPVLAALAGRHRVLAVDLPGHGLADTFDYESADLAAVATTFVRDVLVGLELDTVDLVGCSVGGFVSTVFALDEPRRVRRLVLVGAPLGVTRDLPTPLRVLGVVAKLPLAGRALGSWRCRGQAGRRRGR